MQELGCPDLLREISEDLQRRMRDDAAARKKHFFLLCLRWHPDKNPERVETAKKVFQMLQEKKTWFLA